MESTFAACAIVLSAMCAGSIVGVGERSISDLNYENFVNNPENYHLVDGAGNPISQEAE